MTNDEPMIKIDGSQGEGGGQILRTALSLSAITNKPFTIYNIRASRKKTGLLNQHLTAVKALATVSNARVEGDKIGSGELTFCPQAVQPGTYYFNVGSAGSCTLVLQALLPALLTTSAISSITLEGGTHNPMAPPYDFLTRSFLQVLGKMGARINARIYTYGFFPAGGGRFSIEIVPIYHLLPLTLCQEINEYKIKAYAYSAHIPPHIIKEEIEILKTAFHLQDADCQAREVESPGPGNVVMVEVITGEVTEMFTGFGAKGLPLKKVCEGVIKQVNTYLKTKVPVGVYLADQLLIPMALAGGNTFVTMKPTLHTLTNIDIIKKFLDVEISINQLKNHSKKSQWEIKIRKKT